ncbi:hypothetical protein ACOSQ2_017501 [Xanthoceras sorbifolium]
MLQWLTINKSRNGHETGSGKITHAENLSDEGREAALSIGVKTANPDRRWKRRARLGRRRSGTDAGLPMILRTESLAERMANELERRRI